MPVWSPGKGLAGDPSLVCLVPSPEEETCPTTRTTREEEVTQRLIPCERMRRESEGRLRLDGRSVSNEWRVRSGRGEEEWLPQHHFPSTRKEKGTEPQNSGRICGEEVRGVNTALKKLGCCGAEEVVEATPGPIRDRLKCYR